MVKVSRVSVAASAQGHKTLFCAPTNVGQPLFHTILALELTVFSATKSEMRLSSCLKPQVEESGAKQIFPG